MAIPVEVPKLGNTVEECLISKWCKHKGEAVAPGEVVAEIETDKATFEITAPVGGTLLETFFEEGMLVPVFTNLCVIGEPGESTAAFRPQLAVPNGPAATSDIVSASTPGAPALDRPAAPAASIAPARAWSPRARRFAETQRFHPAVTTGSGPGGRVLEEDLRQLYYASPQMASTAEARPQGRVETHGAGSGTAGMALPADPGPPATRMPGIRERIARRMRESLSTTAQYTLHASADAGGLLRLRAWVKASTGVPDISINHLVTFCAVRAVLEVPGLNAGFIGGRIYQHAEVHIGFACDTPRGLLVPVVRDAHKLSVGELSIRMKELTAQAVQGTIAVDEMSGATFTISNLGNLGIEFFTPLLNPPQVAILGVDAIQLKPVRREGKIEFIDSIGLSLTLDHQVIDGAPGARFLKVVREKIENVESLCAIGSY